MELSYKCDPDITFIRNVEAAMAAVSIRHEELRESDIIRVFDAIEEDLKRLAKKKPVGKHRLVGAQTALYDIVTGVCRWYREDVEQENYIPIRGLRQRMKVLLEEVKFGSVCHYYSYVNELRKKYGNRKSTAG